MQKVELLAPAGDLEKLSFALHYGADAVYVGGEKFNLRQRAANFTFDQLCLARDKTKQKRAKLYVVVNIYAHNQEIQELPEYLKKLNQLRVDGLIVSDPGVFLCAKEFSPDIPLMISTQANSCNWKTVRFWEQLGVQKICLARELTLKEIKEIREKTDIELEVFVHGSMCVAYSGRCLLSNYFVQRDGNRGDCAQPCRWRYHLVEENKPENSLKIEEDNWGTYFLNSKDLCMIKHLPELIETGVSSFKIEGRMKSLNYVSVVTGIYREAIDSYYKNPDAYQFKESWRNELLKLSHREYTTGFYFKARPQDTQFYNHSLSEGNYQALGFIQKNPETNKTKISVKNRICSGDTIEIFRKSNEIFKAQVLALWDIDENPTETLHPGVTGYLETDIHLHRFDIIRKKTG